MKTLQLLFKTGLGALLFLLFLTSCDRDVDLKEDEALRDNVYEQILSDQELFNEFMEEMRESDMPMTWMSQHKPMMRNMYSRNQVRRMMQNNPEVIDSLMQNMVVMMEQDSTMFRRNPQMHRRMMQHLMMMMQRDTAMYGQMQQMMQQRRGKMMNNR
ncbi:MAG: hypothetical protein WBL27_08970 [Salinimicrobium sp.]